jgi:predicted nuclease of predicted toxin-antitoxin system
MAVGLYFDHHMQSAVVRELRARGVDSLTAMEDGADEDDDERLLVRATELGRALVTQDTDFFPIAERWWSAGRHFEGIIFSLPTQVTIGQLVNDLELIAQVSDPGDLRDAFLRLPL